MNFTKMITGVVISAVFTATSLAITFYLFQKNTGASSRLVPEVILLFLE